MKIIAIVGSPRLEGNSSYLADIALEAAEKQGIEVEKISLIEKHIGWCVGHVECGSQPFCLLTQDDGTAIVEKLFSAAGVILASPVYMGTISALMKSFVERTRYRGNELKMHSRSVGLIAVASSTGIEDTLACLERFVTRRSSLPPGKIHQVGGKAKKPGDAKTNQELVNKARELGRFMAEELMHA